MSSWAREEKGHLSLEFATLTVTESWGMGRQGWGPEKLLEEVMSERLVRTFRQNAEEEKTAF